MRQFGVILEKQPQGDRRELIELAVRTSWLARDLPRGGVRPAIWHSRSGRLSLLAWGSSAPVGLYAGELIVATEELALAGAGFYYHPDYAAPEALLRALGEARDPESIVAEMGGSFALVFCDGRRDRFRLWRSVVGQGISFYKDTPQRLVAGTRGLFVSCVGDGSATPSYDPDGAGRFTVFGQCTTDLTPFAGVRHMPPHSVLVGGGPGGAEIKKIDGAFDGFGYGDAEPTAADFDEATRLFLETFEPFKRDGVAVSVTLSGGKDSRLIAAGLAAAGIKATASLGRNWSDHPDLILGERVARLLGLEIRPIERMEDTAAPSRAEIRVDASLVSQLRRWDARMISPMYNPILHSQSFALRSHAGEDRAASAVMTGAAGEMMKGGWAQRIFIGDGEFNRETTTVFLKRFMQGHVDLLKPHNRDAHNDYIADLLEEHYRDDHPMAAYERVYFFVMQNRAMCSLADGNVFVPFANSRLLRFTGNFSIDSRRAEVLHFEIIRRLAPQLANVPIAELRWGFEQNGPSSRYPDGYEARTPLKKGATSRAVRQVTLQSATDLRHFFLDRFAQDRHLLADVVDMDAVDDLLYSRASYELRCARLYWCLEAARLLLCNTMIETFDIAQDPIHTIRVDAPWCTIYGGLHDTVDTAVTQVAGRLNADLLTEMNRLPHGGTPPASRARGIDPENESVRPLAFCDGAGGTGAWRILPAVEGASITAQGAEGSDEWKGRLSIVLPPGRSATSWVPVALGPWRRFAGCTIKLRLIVRSDEASLRVAYLRLQRARSDQTHLLQSIGVRGAPAGQPCNLVLVLPEKLEGSAGGPEPDEIVELWLPMGPTASEVTFDFGPLEIERTRMRLPEVFLDLVAALGDPFSSHVNGRARALADAYEVEWGAMEDVLARIPVSSPDANGLGVTLCDVAANSPAWQDYQIAGFHRLVGGNAAERRPAALPPIAGEEIVAIYEAILRRVKETMGIEDRRRSVGVLAAPGRVKEEMEIR